MAELDIFETTKLILRNEDVPEGIGKRIGSDASSLDIAECIRQLTTRLVAEADRTDDEGADERQMWESMLRLYKEILEAIPLSLSRSILSFCWAELTKLRSLNHTYRRCSCFGNVLDDETPLCYLNDDADLDFDVDEGPESSFAEPSFMDGKYIREQSQAIKAHGRQYASKRPVHKSVTAEEIWNCVVSTLQRAIVEDLDDTNDIAIWQAMLDEDTNAIRQQPASVLVVILVHGWLDVISIREDNHEGGRCSHYGAKIDDVVLACRVGEAFGDISSALNIKTRHP